MTAIENLRNFWLLAVILSTGVGCGICPDIRHRPQFHNPFPQLKRIAVIPFFNQSNEPTLNVDSVTSAYYAELQTIPGFEVLPTGPVAAQWRGFLASRGNQLNLAIDGPTFQQFAQSLGVDAIVVGSVTDYEPYYPPRMAMTVHWYAANPGFHQIPPGYGLPWGTKGEGKIPKWVVRESEAEVARQQLATQTPVVVGTGISEAAEKNVMQASGEEEGLQPPVLDWNSPNDSQCVAEMNPEIENEQMPHGWPDPLGLIPESPQLTPPPLLPQHEPVMSHTRIYNGADENFAERLAAYFELRDDARFGGWQNYLARSDDFVRFCCHVHVTDMLELRGGREESEVILRWPLSRYSR